MRNPHTYPITSSLPLVLAAIAIACSANDEPRSSISESHGAAVAENPNGAPPSAVSDGQETPDEDTLDGAEVVENPVGTPPSAVSDGQETPDENTGLDDAYSNDASPTEIGSGEAAASEDLDNDGLPDSVETNTRRYLSRANTGTDPNNWDSDGDGISDGDEVLGTEAGLNLPAMGTNPLRKNILIEYDWFDDSNECNAHSHRPTTATVNMVSATFAASSVSNPDGSRGVTVIHDYGQGGEFSGGNRIADADGVIDGGVGDSEFANYRSQNFASNRQGYFHYTLLPHRYNLDDSSSGQAEVVGDDLVVSLYCAKTDYNVASTIVHELGHNLGLRHGGDTDTNNKPNYNSVMNYTYQFKGVDTNCTPPGDGVIDYSRGVRISLDEAALDERKGTCGTSSWDWNEDGVFESSVAKDINKDSWFDVLTDHDDWAAIVYDWDARSPSRLNGRSATEIVTCDSRPPGF